MKNEKKLNNKGFSLVELIIVIAIMAVLIGVLAPQYMKYVERGRVASDNDNILAVEDAIKVLYVDPTNTTKFASGTKVTFASSGVTVTGDTNNAVLAAVKNAGLIQSTETLANLPKLTNQNTFTSAEIEITITGGNISTKVTRTPVGGATP